MRCEVVKVDKTGALSYRMPDNVSGPCLLLHKENKTINIIGMHQEVSEPS